MKVENPEKELRFTRAAQAIPFAYAGFMLLGAAFVVYGVSLFREANPALPHPAWALLPFALGILALRLAIHLLRHAYVILTPLGVEILPFFRPRSGMRVIYWNEIHEMEINEKQTHLTLHFNAERTAGVHLSLRPISGRALLVHALRERITKK